MTKARSLSDFIESDGSVTLVDNQKIKVGTGNDLEIYHDGLNSYVQDSGTGSLRLAGADVGLLNAGATDFYINCSGTTVTLYHNGSAKLATTSTGVAVTGNSDVSGELYVGNNNSVFAENVLRFNSGGDAFIDHTTVGQDFNFRTSVSSSLDTSPLTITSSGDITLNNYSVATALTSTGSQQVLSFGRGYWDGTKGTKDSIKINLYDNGGADNYGIGISNQTLEIQSPVNVGIYTGNSTTKTERLGVKQDGAVALNTANTGTEASLHIGPHPSVGAQEGGHFVLSSSSTNSTAIHIDNYTNASKDYLRIMSGTDTSSSAVVAALDITNKGFGIGQTSTTSWVGEFLQTGSKSIFGQLTVNGGTYVTNNLAYNGSSWTYLTSDEGSLFAIDPADSHNFTWYSAPSGTAGANASITEQMHLTPSGDLDVNGIITNIRGNSSISAPVNSDHSQGTRIKFYDGNSSAWYGLGIESGNLWYKGDGGHRWYNSNANNVMELDNNGDLRRPYGIYARGFWNFGSTGSVTSGTTVIYNNNNRITISNGRIYVPVAGRYLVHVQGLDNGTNTSFDSRIQHNVTGSNDAFVADFRVGTNGGGTHASSSATAIVDMAANDYIHILRLSGSQYSSASSTSPHNSWSITFLG